jgi:hypothetical protein
MIRIAAIATTVLLGGVCASGLQGAPASPVGATDAGWTFSAGLVDRFFELPGFLPTTPAAGSSASGPTRVADPIDTDWRTLLGLNYMTGETTEALESRRGKEVRIPGFMVPFEDGMAGVNEFLLVPYFGACIHTPPPPPTRSSTFAWSGASGWR